MNFKYYTTTIVFILMILALSRGFVLQYQNGFSFIASHAHAEGDGGGGAGGGAGGGGGPNDVPGCTDSSATNYNPSATLNDGSCTYVIYGCMDSTATNYNPAATSQMGVTCTYPSIPVPTCTLLATPNSIQTGSESTLSWTTANATSFSIDKNLGNMTPVASGSTTVAPASSITYTGTATGAGGTVICTATITVSNLPPPTAPTCILSALPAMVNAGDHTTLTWITTNAGTFTIDHGVGSVSPAVGGSVNSLAINANTTFTGTVISPTGQSATCTAPVTVNSGGGGGGPSCVLTVSPSSISTGSTATLTWGGSGISTVDIDNGIATATTSSGSVVVGPTAVQNYTYTGTFHATNGQTLSCTATLAVTGGGGGGAGGCTSNCGGGGGGGGGGSPQPTITLAALPHIGSQPLAYLYLSQIPYTGLDLGPVGTVVYWLTLILSSLALAYLVLFIAAPYVTRSAQSFGARVVEVLNSETFASVPAMAQSYASAAPEEAFAPAIPIFAPQTILEAPRGYSNYDGFKSFAHKGALSIEDIVKGLTREHSTSVAPVAAPTANIEPIYENVEPVYEQVESINETPVAAPSVAVATDVRGFTSALIEGDRAAVFAGLRQHLRGGGQAEKLISATACLLDDVYRARIDGTPCDADIARLSARFGTPVLEKLVTSLTTAIDSSYTADVTGAKLALTRALAVLGA